MIFGSKADPPSNLWKPRGQHNAEMRNGRFSGHCEAGARGLEKHRA